jgi:hypothetical protein
MHIAELSRGHASQREITLAEDVVAIAAGGLPQAGDHPPVGPQNQRIRSLARTIAAVREAEPAVPAAG